MSSMTRVGIFSALFLSTMASASMQQQQPLRFAAPAASQASATDINYAIADWRRLKASSGYSFADYARFVNANPGWPGESGIRRSAEKAMRPGENANTVLAFFRSTEPLSGNGWARLAEANLTLGRTAEALAAAKGAWLSSDLSQYDEQTIFSRFGGQLTAADHDKRVDALLFGKKYSDAYRMMAWSTPGRRAAFQARIAMLTSAANADALYRAVESQVPSDAGLLMDRLRFLKDTYNNAAGARWLAARPHNFTYRPADPERFYEMLLILARSAWADRNYQQALDIARRPQAKAFELRAAMSLALLWQRQGQRAESHALLAPIYGWFTEGFDTADLQEAKVLLEPTFKGLVWITRFLSRRRVLL